MAPRSKLHGAYADGVQWFTRVQAARYLGISIQAVKAAQARGALAAQSVQGVSVFSRATLDTYRDSTPRGELAALAFVRFAAGETCADVVIALRVQPAMAESLLEAYARCAGVIVVAAPSCGREEWAALLKLPTLTPALVLRALELCAQTPSLRARLLACDATT
jgi:hypothetical protein